MSFRKLERQVDRGHVYYAYAGESLGTDGQPKKSLGLDFKEGQILKVKWPDGSTSSDAVCKSTAVYSMLDHGIPVDTESALYGIKIEHRGKTVVVDLGGLEIYDASDEGEWSLI